jgi:hypothetical protein
MNKRPMQTWVDHQKSPFKPEYMAAVSYSDKKIFRPANKAEFHEAIKQAFLAGVAWQKQVENTK